jgi:hypothetical protein
VFGDVEGVSNRAARREVGLHPGLDSFDVPGSGDLGVHFGRVQHHNPVRVADDDLAR